MTPGGFEPLVAGVKGRCANLAAPRGRGAGGRNRTSDLLLTRQLLYLLSYTSISFGPGG
jgi:hypothetical protein